jgi:hypothetical protein
MEASNTAMTMNDGSKKACCLHCPPSHIALFPSPSLSLSLFYSLILVAFLIIRSFKGEQHGASSVKQCMHQMCGAMETVPLLDC